MRTTRNLGMIVLAVYLVMVGLSQLIHLSFAGFGILMGLLAIVAGLLIAFGR